MMIHGETTSTGLERSSIGMEEDHESSSLGILILDFMLTVTEVERC